MTNDGGDRTDVRVITIRWLLPRSVGRYPNPSAGTVLTLSLGDWGIRLGRFRFYSSENTPSLNVLQDTISVVIDHKEQMPRFRASDELSAVSS